jgi:phenylpropionate dioxygenase-like ring-hydroxylating dioxygenase large terminal subunit
LNQSLLKNLWYVVGISEELKVSSMKTVFFHHDRILLFRDKDSKVFAIRDICPHRGIPLSYGRIVDNYVECAYHGWKFSGDGVCQEIPALCQGQELDCTKIKVKSYAVYENQGLIWIYFGEKGAAPAADARPLFVPSYAQRIKPSIIKKEIFNCHIDHAVIGLMDPAHGPYVHKSIFWRNEKTAIEKSKHFAPVDYGFQMVRHKPSANSKVYKILGQEISTEITFCLPSLRIEHIRVGKKNLCAVTALTPIDDKQTAIFQLMYWDIPWLFLLKPFLKWFTHFFLHQDIQAVEKQQHGLVYEPSLMLIKDADTQAKWYYQLKDEWEKHQLEQRAFKNPIVPTELRWRS